MFKPAFFLTSFIGLHIRTFALEPNELHPVDCPIVKQWKYLACYELLTAENPDSIEALLSGDDPDVNQVTLSVYRVSRNMNKKSETANFRLQDGPGAPADVQYMRKARLQFDQDVVMWDRRGSGYSRPLIDCVSSAEDDMVIPKRCVEAWKEDGQDLTKYSTMNNVYDMELIRQAFGYNKINLDGVGYGALLAMEYSFKYPDVVRASFVHSPPSRVFTGGLMQRRHIKELLRIRLDLCEEIEECNEKYEPKEFSLEDWLENLGSLPSKEKQLLIFSKLLGVLKEMDVAAISFVPIFLRMLSEAAKIGRSGPGGIQQFREALSGFPDDPEPIMLDSWIQATSESSNYERKLEEIYNFTMDHLVKCNDGVTVDKDDWPVFTNYLEAYPKLELKCQHLADDSKSPLQDIRESNVPTILLNSVFDASYPFLTANNWTELLGEDKSQLILDPSVSSKISRCGACLKLDFFENPEIVSEDLIESRSCLDWTTYGERYIFPTEKTTYLDDSDERRKAVQKFDTIPSEKCVKMEVRLEAVDDIGYFPSKPVLDKVWNMFNQNADCHRNVLRNDSYTERVMQTLEEELENDDDDDEDD